MSAESRAGSAVFPPEQQESPLRLQPRGEAAARYRAVRAVTETICDPLETEDYVIQTMTDVSPPKWHLAHVSWFFETFLLKPSLRGYREFHPEFEYLFNSYYEAVGERHPRPERGLLSRPTVREVYRYREHVDRFMEELIHEAADEDWRKAADLLELGLHHEQQHQELLLTDLKHILAANTRIPPVYRDRPLPPPHAPPPVDWLPREGGVTQIGYEGEGFCYDNEMPRHCCYLQPHSLASRLVTNGEYLEFVEAGGYRNPEYWLSDGWAAVNEHDWRAPLYWRNDGGVWRQMTLAGLRPLQENEPVCHVSYFEADAYARWRGARLPTEAEWEAAARECPVEGNFYDQGALHPVPLTYGARPAQIYGDVWEWTQSPYTPYPGFKPAPGAVGEYNGKFMCNQFVARGGSCATSRSHIRPTYRNFFVPQARWQFLGIRLARDE